MPLILRILALIAFILVIVGAAVGGISGLAMVALGLAFWCASDLFGPVVVPWVRRAP